MEPTALATAAMQGATQIGEMLTLPDGDWEPMMLVELSSTEAGTVPISEWFVNDETRTVFAEKVVPMLISEMGISEVVLVTSMWVGSPERAEAGVGPRDDPDRREAVLVTSISGERVARWMALIERSEDGPPVLGAWEEDPGIYEWGTVALITQNAFEALKQRV